MTIKRAGQYAARYRAMKVWQCIPRVYVRTPTPGNLHRFPRNDNDTPPSAA